MDSGDMTVEANMFDEMIAFTLDDQSELASPNELNDDISDDINEAISIMLTGGDDDELSPEEPECSTQNVTLPCDVDVSASDTPTVSSVLSKASTAPLKMNATIQRKAIKR